MRIDFDDFFLFEKNVVPCGSYIVGEPTTLNGDLLERRRDLLGCKA